MKACVFKCSQHEGRECCFPPNFQQFCCVKDCEINPSQSFCGPCEHLEKQAFTPKTMKISRKYAPCEGVNTFFGKSNSYTRARKKGQIHVMGMVGEIAFTSRRVVFLNRRLVFSNHRVVTLNPGLVKPTPGVAKPTPGLVTAIRRGNFCLFGHQFAETVQLNDTLFAKNNLRL